MNEENEKLSGSGHEYGKKHLKTCKMRKTQSRNWNVERNSEKREI